KKLFKAEDTVRWLEQNGMSHESLERLVSENAVGAKLRDRTVADRVEPYFEQHAADFDTGRIGRLEVREERVGRLLAEEIRGGRLDFFAASQRCFLESADRAVSAKTCVFDVIERRHAAPAIRDQLFAAAPGELLGPVQTDEGYALLQIVATV